MHKKIIAVILIIVFVGLVVIYVKFDPTHSHIAPKCIFKTLTGYDCPSCGGQRALHLILNGDVKRAFMLNPFLFFATPYIALIAYSSFCDGKYAKRLKHIVQSPTMVTVYLFVYVAWWVIRNTPLWRF